jgi:hypothetical protein
VSNGLFINVARRWTCMDQVGVNGAKHEEKWGPESVLKRETSGVNGGDIIAVAVAVTNHNIIRCMSNTSSRRHVIAFSAIT